MSFDLPSLLFLIGIGQWSVLIASALVPVRLNWRESLRSLPTLHRQLFWVYGGYTVMSIVALGLVCLTCSEELAAGSRLARAVCGYGAVFWGVRLSLQAVLQARPYLTTWWLVAGEVVLTAFFVSFTAVYAVAALSG